MTTRTGRESFKLTTAPQGPKMLAHYIRGEKNAILNRKLAT